MLNFCLNSEYKPLKAVLLCRPHPHIENAVNLVEKLHLAKVDYAAINKEYEQIIKVYAALKIKVFFVDFSKIEGVEEKSAFNIIFTRDHFLMTPRGGIISKMFFDIRQGEIKYIAKTLQEAGVPIRLTIQGSGTLEGADALWVNKKLLMVGVGNRTNAQGFNLIKKELALDGVKCVAFSAPREVIHLLGALQFVDWDMALVRVDLVGQEIINFLKENRIKIIKVKENIEIKEKQAMNFVSIAAKEIIMPADCPETKRLYEQAGIKIAAEVATAQLVNAAGGLACVTGILARSE